MEHNVIKVILQARAADQQRKAKQLGPGAQVLFVLIPFVGLAAAIGIVLLYAASRPD